MTTDTLCQLERLIGREAPCPGEPCPFWNPGDGCVLDEATAELAGRDEVTRLLLAVRDRLVEERAADGSSARFALARSLNKTAQHELS
jgi:hypothetical protein